MTLRWEKSNQCLYDYFINYIPNFWAEKQTSRVSDYKEVRFPFLFRRVKLMLAPEN
jgi:hypothetical protein